jgi:deoxyadenosine/deoxycytidine kinase
VIFIYPLTPMLSAIQKIADNKLRYNLAIAGPIGSGKTTLCNYMWDELSRLNLQLNDNLQRNDLMYYYKEWIDHSDICKQMLVNRTNGLISRFTLQSFILDEWSNILTKEPLRYFNLFERSISECSMCFCDDLTFKEYDVLHSREYEIASRFDIPCVDRKFGFCVSTKETTKDIFDELAKQIEADVDYMISTKMESFNRIFGLKLLDAETLVNRIGKRARPGEEDLQIRKMNDHLTLFKRAYNKLEYRSALNIEPPLEEEEVNTERTPTDETINADLCLNGC